ncbi:MAG TPA: hypothetical protein DEO98_03260, partial [Legionellales bacterium]|nr:hypothetical protein [Legionellales bacterium]
MSAFFSALNPVSSNSGITFRATKHPYSEDIRQQNMPDLTLDAIIPFLWHRNLSILDGIYETFSVFYGDHFDKNHRGFGQKGLLDFAVLPLLSRKLMADTYLEKRKNSHFLNLLAWVVALPIKAITFGVALAFTIAVTPIVIAITLVRCLFRGSPPPPAKAMVLPTHTAYAALQVALHRLELMGIRNSSNIRRLLEEPQNLALVYAMERLTYVVDAKGNPISNQEIFDFLLRHHRFWTNVRVIENLDVWYDINQPFIGLGTLIIAPTQEGEFTELLQTLNSRQSTHTASVHSSTSRSAARLKEYYSRDVGSFKELNILIAQRVRNYDKNLVGQRTDDQILQSLDSAVQRLNYSEYVDEASRVSLTNLLKYCWAAVHDETQWREGVTQETAEDCFYAALYEIEWEYALSATGADHGQSGNNQACVGGAFNKMIEGMAKIHKLCEVNFITPATAALQLPCIVRQELSIYLKKNPSEVEKVEKEGLSAVWDQLRWRVLEKMASNFSALYPSIGEEVNPDLRALVETGKYTDLTQYLQNLEPQA